MPTLNAETYYTAARLSYALAADLRDAFDPLHQRLLNASGMAGDYSGIDSWAGGYTSHASDFVTNATNYVNAVSNLGDILTSAGYNWALANHKANPDGGPAPRCPTSIPTSPIYGAECPVDLPPPATGHNGNGLQTDVPGLLDRIMSLLDGGAIPNGDTDKIRTVAKAWTDFARHPTVTAASARLNTIAAGFDGLDSGDIRNFRDHFATLSGAAGSLAGTANAVAAPLTAHLGALDGLRSGMHVKTEIALGVVATVTACAVAAAFFTGGLSLAGGAGVIATAVGEAATAIVALIGEFIAGIAAGVWAAVEGVTATQAIMAIGALTVAMTVAGDSAADHDGTDDPTREIAETIAEHSKERAEQGDGTHYVAGVSPDKMADYVEKMLNDEVSDEEVRYLNGGRVAYWDPATKAVVIEDSGGGSVFTPKTGYDYFQDELN